MLGIVCTSLKLLKSEVLKNTLPKKKKKSNSASNLYWQTVWRRAEIDFFRQDMGARFVAVMGQRIPHVFFVLLLLFFVFFSTSPKLDKALTKIVIGPMSPCWLDVCGRHLRAVLARAGVSTFWRCLTSILEFSASKKYSKEDYKPCKWGATARYYTSLTKTMLPKRKSVPWSSRQSDHTKTSWPSKRDVKCSGMVMSNVHQVWPKLSCKAQWKGKEDKADRGRGGKTTSGNGQAWSSPSPRGQWRTKKNGGNW